MSGFLSRRRLLAVGTAAGAAGVVAGLSHGTAAAAGKTPAGRTFRAVVVASHGGKVEVAAGTRRFTAPVRGFPPGYHLLPGDEVVATRITGHLVVMPLVRVIDGVVATAPTAPTGTVRVGRQPLKYGVSTLWTGLSRRASKGRPARAWAVDNTRGSGTSAVAIRVD